MRNAIYIGCAGWTVRKEHAALFPAEGTHLARYASRFQCVEINSSFYRPHRRATYERWSAATPPGFRFAVKCPRQITHENRLHDSQPKIDQLADEVAGLGDKLGAVLVQLPPSLALEPAVADRFFHELRLRLACPIVCEPRHRSWFEQPADALLQSHRIARVAADPSIVPAAASPAGHGDCAYFRWHGSPRTYYSSYDDSALSRLAAAIVAVRQTAESVWCIFDNTAMGAAVLNAFALRQLIVGL
jgi:uncharacterized protein YecE (DUF72 family)